MNLSVKPISLEEYEAFIEDKDYTCTQAGGQVGRMREKGEEARIAGGFENGELVIAMLYRISPYMKVFHSAYSPRGPVTDRFMDEDLLRAFFEGMNPLLQQDKAAFLKVESGAEIVQHDQDGQIVEGGYDNEPYRQMLQRAGLEPQPLWTDGLDLSRQPRYVSILDLVEYHPPFDGLFLTSQELKDPERFVWKTEEQLMKELSYKTRQDVRGAQKDYIEVRPLAYDELELMHSMEEASGKIHGFQADGLPIFQSTFKGYGDACQVMASFLDLDAYEAWLEKESAANARELEKARAEAEKFPDSKKKQNKVKTVLERTDSLQRKKAEARQLEEQYGRKVPLAAGLFLMTPTETTYLYGGSIRELAGFRGTYAIQWKMIREALARKALRYSFGGISGKYQPDEEGYGVFDFKRGFGARVAEYAGEFILPVNPAVMKLGSLLGR